MKKHMLKETNDMRRLMGLDLLNEEMESAGKEDKKESGDVVNEDDVVGVDAPESKDELEKDEEDHGDVVNEDSEGEETYNYGEDEGADHKEEEHLEHEEDMAPHDRIKAIEDHLEALKKDMGYDEDHEDRDEEGTHFAEGKKYSKILNTLTESEYKKLKHFIKDTNFKGKKYSKILNTLTESEYKKLKHFIK